MHYSRTTGGFYDDSLNYLSIPDDAVEITADQHAALLVDQAAGKTIQADANGYPVAVDPPPPSLADLKAMKVSEIEIAAGAAIAPITSAYPIAERDTWVNQEAEAVAWTANNQAPTPMLGAIAAARGQAIADVVQGVLTKASAFKALAGATFGKRKAKIDQINAATTPEDVAAITW